MSHTGHDFTFDETVLDPHYETRMATIFLYKRAPDKSFRQRRLARVERVARHAWEVGRTLVCVARAVEREDMGIGLHTALGYPVPILLVCGM